MATVEQLLAVLGNRGVARGGELATLLAVSQPTVSRLVAAAGDRLCRMGKARATRYALTRALPDLGARLPIHRVDETGRVHPHGSLHLLAHGRHWLERTNGSCQFFEGTTPFAWDMSPQGYIGRSFSIRYPELNLPPRITDWNENHRLIALARRGEDCGGNLILGKEALDRFLASSPRPVSRADYAALIHSSLLGQAGSSAGGEHPKFTAFTEGSHVLVKFAEPDPGTAGQRWRDLLVCESVALELVRETGIATADATWFDSEGCRFLELKRFDRISERGRKGLLSLTAINNEYLGIYHGWTEAALALQTSPRIIIDAEDVRRARWLDAFGQLIGNDDRHFGNLSFFVEEGETLSLQLAPVYDMLPMMFAPRGVTVLDRNLTPPSPTSDNFDVWPDAARSAMRYWSRLAATVELSRGFRDICARCRDAVNSSLS